jgi:hypothetical protein
VSREPKKTDKGCGLGLTWAGTEARPTEEKVFSRNRKLETGNLIFLVISKKIGSGQTGRATG